jgi:hypothetical protein
MAQCGSRAVECKRIVGKSRSGAQKTHTYQEGTPKMSQCESEVPPPRDRFINRRRKVEHDFGKPTLAHDHEITARSCILRGRLKCEICECMKLSAESIESLERKSWGWRRIRGILKPISQSIGKDK